MNSVMEKAEVLALAFIFHSNLLVDSDPVIMVGSGFVIYLRSVPYSVLKPKSQLLIEKFQE